MASSDNAGQPCPSARTIWKGQQLAHKEGAAQLVSLPNELLLEVLYSLKTLDLLRLEAVSRRFRKLASRAYKVVYGSEPFHRPLKRLPEPDFRELAVEQFKHDRDAESKREEEPPVFTQCLLYDIYFCHNDEIYEETTEILLTLQKSTYRGNPKWEEAVAIALVAQGRYTEAAGYFAKLDLEDDETRKNMVLAAARFGWSSELGEQPRASVQELMNKSFIGMACRGDLKGMKYLHEQGVSLDITVKQVTAAKMAAMSGHVHILEFLHEHGVNILSTSSDDSSLSIASQYGQKKAVEFFLKHGSEISMTSDFLGPPFQHAVEWGYIDILRLFIKHEPTFNEALAPDGSLRLAPVFKSLHMDTKQRIELLKYFVQEVHININELDKNGRSALHYAMEHGNIPLVREMMELNADPHALDVTGQSPLEFAANNDRTPDGEALIQWLSERPEKIPCRSIQKLELARTIIKSRRQSIVFQLAARLESDTLTEKGSIVKDKWIAGGVEDKIATLWVRKYSAATMQHHIDYVLGTKLKKILHAIWSILVTLQSDKSKSHAREVNETTLSIARKVVTNVSSTLALVPNERKDMLAKALLDQLLLQDLCQVADYYESRLGKMFAAGAKAAMSDEGIIVESFYRELSRIP